MAEIDIAPPPAAEGTPPVADETVALPNPIDTQRQAPEPDKAEPEAQAEKKRTIADSVAAAAKKVEENEAAAEAKDGKAVDAKAQPDGKEKPAAADDKTADSAAKTRDDKGKFTSANPEKAKPAPDAPARFNPEARGAWATTPDPVRSEVARAFSELEKGLQDHQKRWEPLKEFDELAKKSGTTIDRALREYVGIDRLLGENFVAGMQRIAANKGIDLRTFAADVLNLDGPSRQALGIQGQPQRVQLQSPRELAMQREIDQLKGQLNQVNGSTQQQRAEAVNAQIAAFAADKPLFNELATEIASYITAEGLSLEDAYAKAVAMFEEKAKRAGFMPRASQPSPAAQPQTLAGRKSIKGAPGPGSNPVRKTSSSIKEAIARAAAAVG